MKVKTEMHSFYCPNCGEKIYDLPRPVSHQYQKHHKKKLWCWKCHNTLNAVECRNDIEVYEFKQKFENGDYKEEVIESLTYTQENNIRS